MYKDKIFDFYSAHKRMPSYAEIMRLIGFKSKNAVYKLVSKLVDEGVLSKDRTGKLIPARMIGEIPLLGLVEAGFPEVAEQTELDTLSLDQYLIPKKEKTYLLEVKGDSMIDAGIQEGDLVLAERVDNSAKPGDIVIAELDGGWTLKYFRKKGDKVYLEAANAKYPDMYPEESFHIPAIVRGVVRKY